MPNIKQEDDDVAIDEVCSVPKVEEMVVSTGVLVKGESTDELLDEKPRKRQRVFMEAVVVPTLKYALKLEEEKKEDFKKLKKLKNPKLKLKGNLQLNDDSIRARLLPIGLDLYPIDLEQEIRDVYCSRAFMSYTFGGNVQQTFPQIREEKIQEHGMNDFAYLTLEWNPHAPQVPGAPGLFFRLQLTPAEPWPTKEERVICRLNGPVWMYMGQYQMAPAPSLTPYEWLSQPSMAHNVRANGHDKDEYVRARIGLRKELGRTARPQEVQDAVDAKRNFDVTLEEVKEAFAMGRERIAVWTMKCVGYDAAFQRRIANEYPTWVPPPPKAKKGTKARRPAAGGKTPTSGKRKRVEINLVSSDEEQDGELGSELEEAPSDDDPVAGARYVPRGTRSRPSGAR